MAELDLFFNFDDEQHFVTIVLDAGMELIPNLQIYETPHEIVITSIVQYQRMRERTSTFFLTHRSFSGAPPRFRPHPADSGRNGFYVIPRYGGPFIDFMASSCIEGGKLTQGFLAYYATYFVSESSHLIDSPSQLKAMYNTLTREVRRRSTKIPGKRTYWIGRGARDFILGGGNLVGLSREDVLKALHPHE